MEQWLPTTEIRKALVVGRRPHLRVAPTIADATATGTGRIRARGHDDLHDLRLIVDRLTRFGTATRQDIDCLLLDKLGDALTSEQKTRKIANLLTKLRRDGHIRNSGSRTNPVWTLADRPD